MIGVISEKRISELFKEAFGVDPHANATLNYEELSIFVTDDIGELPKSITGWEYFILHQASEQLSEHILEKIKTPRTSFHLLRDIIDGLEDDHTKYVSHRRAGELLKEMGAGLGESIREKISSIQIPIFHEYSELKLWAETSLPKSLTGNEFINLHKDNRQVGELVGEECIRSRPSKLFTEIIGEIITNDI